MSAAEESEFTSSSYLRAKSVWRGKPVRRRRVGASVTEGEGTPFGFGRDPRALGDLLVAVSTDMGWSSELDQARLITEWPIFAGELTAEHTTVVGISHGVLQVQCDSTTWATELRRLRAEMLTRRTSEEKKT